MVIWDTTMLPFFSMFVNYFYCGDSEKFNIISFLFYSFMDFLLVNLSLFFCVGWFCGAEII